VVNVFWFSLPFRVKEIAPQTASKDHYWELITVDYREWPPQLGLTQVAPSVELL
jgi:hypothetical protein